MSQNIATREAYGIELAKLGENDRVVVLDADLSKSTRTELFKQKYPERFINVGIAESNMMSIAAGIASCGKIVFASTFAMFAAGRAFEQIRNSICYPKLNVKVCATHAGITVGEDGASHQTVEDIALMTAVPNITVISPADAIETSYAIRTAFANEGPFYIRLGRLQVPPIYNESEYNFELGKGITIKDGRDVAIIATGIMVGKAIEAADLLETQGISARVIDIHTIKPIDKDLIIKAAKETRAIVTAEEHNVIGGLGSIISSVLVENIPTPLKMVGINDKFGKSGNPDKLMEMYGLTSRNIIEKVKEVISLK